MEGERELVLGNKQLVSFFFVVVALCGVFFALGYIIRGNSSKQATTIPDANTVLADRAPSPQPQDRDPPREAESPVPAAAPAAIQTQPAHDIQPQAAPLETGGSYLQIAALRRADAENLVKTLREQGFPGMLEQSSKPDLFRVLVGPYHLTAEVADIKLRLKTLGFSEAQVEKK